MRTIDANIAKGALNALQSPQASRTETVLTSLINAVADVPERIIIVFDGYHTKESSPVDDALTYLLEHLPLQIHLVIAKRVDPSLALGRLRALGQLTELRAKDLRLSTSEAAEFLNQVMGLNLSVEDLAVLETRTEGWIAGLQLAAILIQGHEDTANIIKSFTGSHCFVLDYLIEEVLEQQPDGIQAFLLQNAILNRLTGSLYDALTGLDIDQMTLEMVESANLFIVPLDEERRWYRYHHLFTDLLRQRLGHSHPEQVPILHAMASEWYEQNGFADKAIEHALHAKEFNRVLFLIEKHVDTLWGPEHTKLKHWLAGLPGELLFSRPQLCIFHGWYQFVNDQLDAAERPLQTAEQMIDSSTDRSTETVPQEQVSKTNSDRMKLRGRAATVRAFLASYREDVSGIIQHGSQALEYLPE